MASRDLFGKGIMHVDPEEAATELRDLDPNMTLLEYIRKADALNDLLTSLANDTTEEHPGLYMLFSEYFKRHPEFEVEDKGAAAASLLLAIANDMQLYRDYMDECIIKIEALANGDNNGESDPVDPDTITIGDFYFYNSCLKDEQQEPKTDIQRRILWVFEDDSPRDLPTETAKRLEKFDFPIDKINSRIWTDLKDTGNGQIKFDMAGKNDKDQVPVFLELHLAEMVPDSETDPNDTKLKLSKQLSHFDKRVYSAVANLYLHNNRYVSLRQIYFAMGYTGNPTGEILTKINDSIVKMMGAILHIDNAQEAEIHKSRAVFEYNGPLLPAEEMTALINGQLVESALHIFREPPAMSFARERKQLTTFPIELLQSKPRKVEENLRIEDYLLERIAHMKNGKQPKQSNRILYDTLFKKTAIKMRRNRALDKIQEYLEHYRKCDFIKGFTMDKDGITIII